nr:DUF3156 family protein [uncultured Pseudogulbenkiania sp.]
MLTRLAERLRARQPGGYRPGLTLERVRHNLAPLECQVESATLLHCNASSGLAFDVRERVEPMFLAHTVLCEFELAVPGSSTGPARLELQHTGAFKREGIRCVVKQGDRAELATLIRRIEQDASLRAAILPLDFRRCELIGSEQGWLVRIEHFGASEVVNRLPPMRRYIRLTPEQRQCLLASFVVFIRLLGA